jgi:ABC-2 type transport system permease protein
MTLPLRTLKPVIVKELRQVRRDPTSLGMLMVLPAVLIIMVGYALNFDVKHTPLVVYDQDRTPGSRAFLEKFKNTEYFDYRFEARRYADIEDLFLHGQAKIAVVVPASFAAGVASGEDEHVQILVDGSDANTAGQAVATASRLTSDYATHVVADAFMKRGRALPVPVDFQPRVWYNPDLVSSKFLIPGLIGFIIVLTAVISTSLTVVREKERGTMEQLMVSPLRPLEIVLGKTIPYLGISLIAASAILILGYILFDVQVAGSLLLLYAAILMIILGGLGQGLLISTVTDSQQVAFMISVFSSLLPSFLLSGFVFPVATMPVVLRILSNLAVNKFFLVVVRGVMLKGVGFGAVWEQFLCMFAFAAFMLLVSAKRMQKRSA